MKISFTEENFFGNLVSAEFEQIAPAKINYRFFCDETEFADPYCKEFANHRTWGKILEQSELECCAEPEKMFDWEKDRLLHIPMENSILYGLHVRGFTKHVSAKTDSRGSFLGMTDKIPYLKELGITGIVCMPVYTFLEQEKETLQKQERKTLTEQINYWGFKKGFYYAPNACYTDKKSVESPDIQFKQMVKTFHQNGIEVLLQFYFDGTTDEAEILNVLRYWRLQYHVDGFHLKGAGIPADLLAADPLLQDGKLFYYDFSYDKLFPNGGQPQRRHLASFQNTFQLTMRKFLKGDDNIVQDVVNLLRENPSTHGVIHYIADYEGFRLADLVSYERKHNEANGENNLDGTDYNCSWNCGVEGPSRRKMIQELRLKLMKNALTMVFLAQGTPYLFMGDEFGFSQQGNNNPYCQDNEISWLNWKWNSTQQELLDFTRELISFRKKNIVFHQLTEYRMMDYKRAGSPDLSIHGLQAWKADIRTYSREIALLYSGAYGTGTSFFTAYNMHWQEQTFALPSLSKGEHWQWCFDTSDKELCKKIIAGSEQKNYVTLPERTIAVYRSSNESN
ncbi:MAG: alpha-amylase family glycosyl hydrolase [Lachnospiraceae bacterium]|nr:alpha-amylase family glycosyl hydrolase [Lachnospiraceae bacterium]